MTASTLSAKSDKITKGDKCKETKEDEAEIEDEGTVQEITKKKTSMKDKAKVKKIQRLMINSKTKAKTLKVASEETAASNSKRGTK